jgi:hypothetical protein
LQLPLLGECVAGKLLCVQTGKCQGDVKCVGGVPPRPKVCSPKDNDCDGKPDTDGPCPDPNQRCNQLGQCSVPCADIEFSPCPGGLVCQAGYCIPPELVTAAGSGGSDAAGSTGLFDAGTQPTDNGGSSGSANSDAGSLSGAGTGSGNAGASASTGSAAMSGSNLPPRKFALATGGGGASCSTLTVGRPAQPMAALVWLAIIAGFARRRRRPRGGRVDEVSP